MGRSIVVVDVRKSGLYAAEIRQERRGAQCVRATRLPLAAGDWRQAVAGGLTALAGEWGIRGRETVVTVPRDQCVVRMLPLPPVPPERAAQIVRMEADRLLPALPTGAAVAHVLGSKTSQEQIALVAAVPMETVEAFEEAMERAGMRPAGLLPSAFALWSAMRAPGGADPGAGRASPSGPGLHAGGARVGGIVVALAGEGMEFLSYDEHGRPHLSHAAPWGDSERIEHLVRTIRLVIEAERADGHPVQEIWLTGSEADDHATAAVAAETGLPCRRLPPVMPAATVPAGDPGAWSVALGAGRLVLANEAQHGLIFSDRQRALRHAALRRRRLVRATALGVATCAVLAAGGWWWMRTQQSAVLAWKADLERMAPLVADAEALAGQRLAVQRELTAWASLVERRADWPAAFEELDRLARDTVWLTRVTAERSRSQSAVGGAASVTLAGYAPSNEAVAAFVAALESSPRWEAVRLALAKVEQGEGSPVVSFTVNASLRVGRVDDAAQP